MLSCLVCTSKNDRFQAIKSLIFNVSKSEVMWARYQEDIAKNLANSVVDVFIIDLPYIGDHHEMRFVMSLHQRYPDICMMILVAHQYIDKIQEQIEGLGILIVAKPLQRDIFKQFLTFVSNYQCHMKNYQMQQKKLLKQISEMKQFYLAKCLLMENEYMSESMAHHYVEKEAMNQRVPKITIVKNIINKYERD